MSIRAKMVPEFYIDDHAVMYGLMLKYAKEIGGAQGEEASVKGTILYAKERGLRMAMRCHSDGEPLTTKNYMAYGEWVDNRGWQKNEIVGIKPYLSNGLVCGWCESWKKHGLAEFGEVYCTWIDKNLVKGFNPENELKIETYLSHGDPSCGFDWGDAGFETMDDIKANGARKASLAYWTIMDFLFHTGHVLSALARTYYIELGLPKGEEITKKALAEYCEKFGKEKTEILIEESKKNFLLV